MGKRLELTFEGQCQIKEKIKKLNVSLRETEKSLQRTIDLFGLDDEQYHEEVENKHEIESEIYKWEQILENTVVIEGGDRVCEQVEIGSVVVLNNHSHSYKLQIVTSIEADPLENKISEESPIGSSVIGKKVGDKVNVVMPGGEVEYKISGIE